MSGLLRLSPVQMAWRVAQDIPHGAYVNLGIGLPEQVARHQVPGRDVVYHSENGILGVGPAPEPGAEDWDLINAGKKAITLRPGAAFFDHATSFAMVRGGHLDLAVLGAYQVSSRGDLANWRIGTHGIPAVGGAMDLVCGARQVFVMTEHVTRHGAPKLVEACAHPLTGARCVTRVYTDIAVIDIGPSGFVLREKVDGLGLDEVRRMTGAPLAVEGGVGALALPPG